MIGAFIKNGIRLGITALVINYLRKRAGSSSLLQNRNVLKKRD